MTSYSYHQLFGTHQRVSQSLRNDRCQNILYKAVFEHFNELPCVAALLLASKSFQNSSFGANFLVNFVVDDETIPLLESVLSPSSCFSLQFVPALNIRQRVDSKNINRSISNFVGDLANAMYLHLSLRSLTLLSFTHEDVSCFFGGSSNAWPQLQDLALECCELNDSVLEIIAKNTLQLREVNFSRSSGVTDGGLEHLSQLSDIRSLDLGGCKNITDAGLEHISTLSDITSLELIGCILITDAGLERVSYLSGITSLDLGACKNITDAGLEHISTLSDIISLNLGCCSRITDAGLEHVSKLSRIIFLGLVMCSRITDLGLERVSKLASITWLNLSFGNFTDAGLEHIAKLSNINSLDLSYCSKITDVGLQHLWKLAGCTSLNLAECRNITVAETTKLRSALPNCTINE